MLTMPSLLIGLLHSDIWELFAGDLTSRVSAQKWNKYWNRIWPDIWLNGGQPLLTGMNRTSGLAASYGQLEGDLISQSKREFGKALHSGKLDNMQHKLKREMYRRFWAPHQYEITKSRYAQLRSDIYDQLLALRIQYPEWPHWITLMEKYDETEMIGTMTTSIFDRLRDRLGGEPEAQGSFMLDLPSGVSWLAMGNLLSPYLPEHCQNLQGDLDIWNDLSNNTSTVMCLDGVAFLCERPQKFQLNEEFRAHCDSGPFLTYADGFAEYALDGVLVPSFVIENPESISVKTIEATTNIEVRRVILEKFGVSRYISEAGVEPIHEDEYGTLFRRELPGDESLVLLRVINSTPEPDGTYKEYFLRVPPEIETAKQAVAWTFGFESDSYQPLVQT
jgi:hypothetical protein